MTREFSIVRELSRREVERHTKRFIGVTVSEPSFRELDDGARTEWACDIRVGVREGWAVIRNALVAQWAVGAITDINIPVLCERSEAGRITIIARSEVDLPDIILDSYSYEDLDLSFMRNLTLLDDGSFVDGFGFEILESTTDAVITTPTDEVGNKITETFVSQVIEWGSTDFEYGVTNLGDREQFVDRTEETD